MGQQVPVSDEVARWERILTEEGLGHGRARFARGERILVGELDFRRMLPPLGRDATHEQHKLREWMVPLIEQLPQGHQDLLYATFYERATQDEMAERLEGIARRSVRDRVETALNALVRVMALTDPEFAEAEAAKPRRRGGQVRDLEGEKAAAYRAYLRAMDYED